MEPWILFNGGRNDEWFHERSDLPPRVKHTMEPLSIITTSQNCLNLASWDIHHQCTCLYFTGRIQANILEAGQNIFPPLGQPTLYLRIESRVDF